MFRETEKIFGIKLIRRGAHDRLVIRYRSISCFIHVSLKDLWKLPGAWQMGINSFKSMNLLKDSEQFLPMVSAGPVTKSLINRKPETLTKDNNPYHISTLVRTL